MSKAFLKITHTDDFKKRKKIGQASTDKSNTSNNDIKEELDKILNEFTVLYKKLKKLRESLDSGSKKDDSLPGPSQKPIKRNQGSIDDVAPQPADIKSRRKTLKLDEITNEGVDSAAHTQRDDAQPGPSHQDFLDLTNDDTKESVHNITVKKEKISTPEPGLIQDYLNLDWNPNPQLLQPAFHNYISHLGGTTSKSVSAFFTTKKRDNEKLLNYFTRKLEQGRSLKLPEEIICQGIIENSKDESLKSWARETNCNNINTLFDYITKRTALEYSIS